MFVVVQKENAGGNAGGVENAAGECDHTLQLVGLHQLLSDLSLFSTPEQDALGQDNSTPACLGIHRFDHVLEPCEVSVGVRGATPEITPVDIAAKLLRPPVFQGKGGIRHHTIKGLQAAPPEIIRASQRIPLSHVKIPCAMQKQVHPGNGGGGQILFLTIDSAVGSLVTLHVTNRFNQHTACAAGGVIHRLARLRGQQHNHQLDNGAWGVKFAGVLF